MSTEPSNAPMAQPNSPPQSAEVIRAVRLPTQLAELELLVPYALIAEITDVSLPAGSIRLGRNETTVVDWRGQRVPLISLEAMNGEPVPTIGRRVRCAVLYGTDPERALPYFAVLLSGVPRSEQVVRGQIEGSGAQDNPLWRAVAQIGGRLTAIPDVRVLEERIEQMRLGEQDASWSTAAD